MVDDPGTMRRTICVQTTFKEREWESIEPHYKEALEFGTADSKADFVRYVLKQWALSHPMKSSTMSTSF